MYRVRDRSPHPTRTKVSPCWNNARFSPNAPAEIARARLRPCPVMITSVIHVPCHPTAGPSEGVRAVLVEFRQIPFKLRLEPLLEVIAFLKTTGAKTSLFLLAHPSDQLQLPFVFRAILAFAVLIVPVSAEPLVCRPILPLAVYALKTTCRQRTRRISWMIALTAIRATSAL